MRLTASVAALPQISCTPTPGSLSFRTRRLPSSMAAVDMTHGIRNSSRRCNGSRSLAILSPRRTSPVPRTGTPALRAGRRRGRRGTTTLAFGCTLPFLLRYSCFKVFVAVVALTILSPTSQLTVAVNTAAVPHQLTILQIITEALCVPGEVPGTRGNNPLSHIVVVP